MSHWKSPKAWLHGLVAALVSAVAGAASLMIIDPEKFNPFSSGDWRKLLAGVFVQSILATCAYLKQSPLPTLAADSSSDNPGRAR